MAAKSVDSRLCIRMEKLAEGAYNKVFKLTMDDEKTVVARIPNPNAGPAGLTTASEAATLDFVNPHAFYRTLFLNTNTEVYCCS